MDGSTVVSTTRVDIHKSNHGIEKHQKKIRKQEGHANCNPLQSKLFVLFGKLGGHIAVEQVFFERRSTPQLRIIIHDFVSMISRV